MDLVVSHIEYLGIELKHLVNVDDQANQGDKEEGSCEIEISLLESPIEHTEQQK